MYLPNVGDFLVETNKKVGILSATGETKVQIMYDSIELMDSDSGLYVVKKDDKYGVIDVRGNIKIYIENDEIGMDVSKFSQNNIKNKYIFAENLIPVRNDKYWGLYDTKGNQVVEYKYDSLGYVASNNKDAINLLVIPNYNVLVACKDQKYTLINSSGSELFAIVADDIYMTISGGEKHYYITINDNRIDAEEWMDLNGIRASSQSNTDSKNNSDKNSSDEQSDKSNTEEQQDNNQNNNENNTQDNNQNNNENNTQDNNAEQTNNNEQDDANNQEENQNQEGEQSE